jgi:two-component system, cell cycle sensor histidine kinase DivJ
MMSAASSWRDLSWMTAGALTPQSRLRLFRRCRLTSAAAILAVFPPMAMVSGEPFAAIAALFLFGLLPACIALDVRRPGGLDRAVLMSLAACGALMLAGMLRGIPPISALALLSICLIEAIVVGTRAIRLRACAIVASAAVAMVTAVGFKPELSFDGLNGVHMPWITISIAVLTVANVALIAFEMTKGVARERGIAQDQRVQSREIETMVSETVVATDGSGAVLRVSDNAERVLGLPADALRGRGLTELVLVADRPQLLTALCDCAKGGATRRLRLRLRTSASNKAPSYRWIEANISHSVAGGETAMATLRDISDQVADEERLGLLACDAEAAKTARAAFLSTVNHELRTPLNAIIGFSDILATPSTAPQNPERITEYARIINGAGQDLLRMVTAMIDVTRLDSGVYEFEAEVASLAPLVESAVDAFRQDHEGKEIKVSLTGTDENLKAAVDQRAMRSVLAELLSNAAKFGGSAGTISVMMSSGEDTVMIKISDRGPGIPEAQLATLGRHFGRLDERLSREHGGIGLGLSLVRGLVSLHNGQVSFESAPGKGATVTVALPRPGAASIAPSNIHPLILPAAAKSPAVTAKTQERRRA